MKISHHQEITNTIIAAIEAGTESFQMPWASNSGLPIRAASGEPYKGINIITLWAEAQVKGYSSNLWGGFGHWSKAADGAHVRKGEKSTKIIKFSMIERENKKTGEIDNIPRTKMLSVFNRDQIEGLPDIEQDDSTSDKPLVTAYGDRVLAMAENLGAAVTVKGGRACYIPSSDRIEMPDRKLFIERENISADVAFASTLCHEVIHWTGHKDRLDRGLDKRDKPSYAREEMIAECGAAFLCSEFNFSYSGVEDHAGYIASWLKVLKSDNTAIFTAASLASKAVEYVLENEKIKAVA